MVKLRCAQKQHDHPVHVLILHSSSSILAAFSRKLCVHPRYLLTESLPKLHYVILKKFFLVASSLFLEQTQESWWVQGFRISDLKPSLPQTIPTQHPFVVEMEEARSSESLAQENWMGPNQLRKQGCKLILTWEVIKNLQ